MHSFLSKVEHLEGDPEACVVDHPVYVFLEAQVAYLEVVQVVALLLVVPFQVLAEELEVYMLLVTMGEVLLVACLEAVLEVSYVGTVASYRCLFLAVVVVNALDAIT